MLRITQPPSPTGLKGTAAARNTQHPNGEATTTKGTMTPYRDRLEAGEYLPKPAPPKTTTSTEQATPKPTTSK